MWIVAVSALAAVAFGVYRRVVDGRFRPTSAPGTGAPAGPVLWHGRELGARATLVQFSTAFCAPCRVTRRILEDVAATEAGVRHLDLDAEHELALVRELGITRTPTTLILDAGGREVARAAGAPRKDQVLTALPDA
ncbi:MAG: thioredoxin family protein [Nocardioides sp.]|uniref:thioredoxin family protein n=1 Tax=Nocardioides sp. TaxID=35761 RepID=UPI0039E47B31